MNRQISFPRLLRRGHAADSADCDLRHRYWRCLCIAGMVLIALLPASCLGVTSKSPEVKKLIESGLERLGRDTDTRLGGRCVVALAFIKAGRPNHERVREAVAACRRYRESGRSVDIYSNGLAIIFLCEKGAKEHWDLIDFYLSMLMAAQKPHGGWGYSGRPTGDTSQTQYAALAIWEANRNGFPIDASAVSRLADWLLKTQDPMGAWGYQGKVGGMDRTAEQNGISVTMVSAGLGSVLICADMIGAMPIYVDDPALEPLPEALRGGRNRQRPQANVVGAANFDESRLGPAIHYGKRWMEANYKIDADEYDHYYLYALERFKSFEELYDGLSPAEPSWYNEGFQLLETTLSSEGGWKSHGCGAAVDTAFAVLFLLRSTQSTIRASLGEGSLTGGRGLPANVANAVMRRGQIVARETLTKVEDMMHMIDEDQAIALDELAQNPSTLVVDQIDQASRRRLQQLVRAPEPELRILAVRALSRTGDLDDVPTLIYALTDPDRQVVLAARDGLRFTSRRFDGFGLPNDFTEKQRYDAIELWKSWCSALRPDVVFER